MKKNIIERLSKKYGKGEKLIKLLFKICEDNNQEDSFQYVIMELKGILK